MWQDRAECRDADPELFFPTSVDTDGVRHAQIIIANYCHNCAVPASCRRLAERTGTTTGIWGGRHLDRVAADAAAAERRAAKAATVRAEILARWDTETPDGETA